MVVLGHVEGFVLPWFFCTPRGSALNYVKEKKMLIRRDNSRKSRGFTLTEAAIVLGIVGLILGAIWVAAGAVYNNQRIATTSTQILQMVNGIRSLYAASTTVDIGDISLNLAKAGAVPKDMVLLNSSNVPVGVRDIWDGDVTITGVNSGENFSVAFEDVPQEACANLLVRLTGQGRDTGFISAGAASQILLSGKSGITVTEAVASCAGATNTLTFIFKLRS